MRNYNSILLFTMVIGFVLLLVGIWGVVTTPSKLGGNPWENGAVFVSVLGMLFGGGFLLISGQILRKRSNPAS